MRLLLVMPNYNYGGPYHISLGIMYVSAFLKREGRDVTTLNLNHYGADRLAEVLRAGDFDLVATGGLFTYYPHLRGVIATVRRESPRSRVVLGGPAASADPPFALDSLAPDYLVVGEAEKPLAGLLRALDEGRDGSEVPGLAFRRGGRFFQTPPAELVADLDSLPWPDYEGVEYGRYLERWARGFDQLSVSPHPVRRSAPVISGRGCVARCTFCYRLTPGHRQRSIPAVLAEIRHLKDRYGVNEVTVSDDLFSSTRQRLEEFCAGVRPLGLTWACQLRVPVVSEPLLRTMKESGCNLVSYGLESASPAILRSMRKGIDVSKLEEALRLTRAAELTIQGNFIFGDPAETWETAQETLSFYRRHVRDYSNSITLNAVVPYPGTVLYQELKAKGRLRNLQRFYETGLDERGRHINMTSMPDAEFQRLVTRVLPAEERRGRLFGRVLERRRLGPGAYAISYLCPICERRSDDLRLEVAAAFPVSSFRVACRRCLQRSYVPKLGLLGWEAAPFLARAAMGGLWSRFKSTELFAAVRYHPRVDELWNLFKEDTARRRQSDPSAPGFHELSFLDAVLDRLRFAWELAGILLRGRLGG